jgi:hypothetical protein
MRNFKRRLAIASAAFLLSLCALFGSGVTIPGYSIIQQSGSSLTARNTLNFAGAGVSCVDSGGKTVCTISGAATPFYQTVDDEGTPLTQRAALNFIGAGVTCSDNAGLGTTDCNIPSGAPSSNQNIRSFGGSFDGGGSALTVGAVAYVTVPFACTIAGYGLTLAPSGTISFDVWKIPTGTAIPTVANTIISGSSYLSISSGTAVFSTSTAAFTTTTVAAKDILAFEVQAVGTATQASIVIQCNATT